MYQEFCEFLSCVYIHLWNILYKYEWNPSLDKGAQWLSGSVLDSRPRGCWFEPQWRHCVVVLEQDTFILA